MKQYKVDVKLFNFSPKEFRCYRDTDGVTYVHKFSVLKHNNTSTLDCEFSIMGDSGDVIINVYDMNRNLYAPYYNVTYGDFSPVLTKINTRINQELKRLGIRKNDKRRVR